MFKWARLSIGLTKEEVAKRTKKTVDEVSSWEKGESSPTFIQLERWAESIYKRPVALFFFSNPPEEDSPKMDFRTLPDTITDNIPYEIHKVYRKAKILQMHLEELFDGEKPSEEFILDHVNFNPNSDLKTSANELRKFLGISFEEQFSCRNSSDAFKQWRNALENKGIFIFKDAFHNDSYSGFSLFHKYYPIIYTNNSMSFNRQIFTIFHETAHLLLNISGIDFYSNEEISSEVANSEIEIKCNQFASEFLVPEPIFLKENLDFKQGNIGKLAVKYSVSREFIIRKLKTLKIIDHNVYNDLMQEISVFSKPRKGKNGGDNINNLKAYLGDNYIELVVKNYYRNKISFQKLSDFFFTNESTASKLSPELL